MGTPKSDLTSSEVTPIPSLILPTRTPREPKSGSPRSSMMSPRSTPPSHAQLRMMSPMNPSSSTRTTSASSTARSELLSDPSSDSTAVTVLSPRRTSPTFSPSEPAECETSSPELPTAKHSNNSFTFPYFQLHSKKQ